MATVPPAITGRRSNFQRVAVATAALPVVMLSSLALAQTANAAQPHPVPATPLSAKSATNGHEAALRGSAPTVRPSSVAASVPTRVAPAAPAAAPAPSSYTIANGDTVSSIAARFGLKVSDVLALNNLQSNTLIFPGKTLKLTGSTGPSDTAPAPTAQPAGGSAYTIKTGDTLTSIAASHHVALKDLMSANGLSPGSTIYAGKTLTIPGTGEATGSVQPAAATVTPNQQVASTFLGYTYPDAVVAQANVNKAALMAAPVPTPAQMKQIVASTATQMGVDPSLALAFAQQESGFHHQAVSPANAIGTMQVIPSSGQWASELVGRHLNLLDPYDNVTAGVAIIRALVTTSHSTEDAIAGYYQGQTSLAQHGMFDDTKDYVAAITANRALFR